MSHRKGGLQGERTCKLIRRALIELVEEKGFAEVTVGEIAARAPVNRATFYRYYRDKYALVEEIFQDVVSELSAGLGPTGQVATRERIVGWERLFEHVGRHHRLYAALLGRRGDPWFAARLRERCVELARDRLRTVQDAIPGAGRDAESDDLQLVLAANMILGAITWWLEHHRPRSAHDMAEAVVRFATQGYFDALGIGTAQPG
ncbi:TetR/AcrR family transcriptional regulator [Streptomyces sp. TRM S81-3]|uniref:TetR/AcrR family transcriptional regulator n=1 Tax=Streptomyces griseicoloratus TaxID=2752516 RepID=A0A926L622_9ACTN|nr:TetR/AcrR family transcriptional regulator [Streptomyces griseicoloratus]MBD0421729.1 TetR/AcrR family transcriptional regulator [Streptomyces griseicoloratus]